MHITEAALKGAHIATIPYKVLMQLFKHPLTDKGIEAFLRTGILVLKHNALPLSRYRLHRFK